MFKIKSLALILIITVSVSFAALSGCKSKSADMTGSTSSGQRDPQKMKEQITSGLKSLVSDGTITQAQSDKIKTVLTQMTNRMGSGSKPSGSGTPSDGSRLSRPSGSMQSGTQSGNRQSGGQGFSPLSSLVQDGTITQDQADTVMQRIFGDTMMGGGQDQGQNNQGSPSGTQSSGQQA
ncbi:MAG TPA: hypothetical protein VHO66_03280 [Ruminiclostridium sp.]|nr:hypothetical protein [Ruminiclostridium sp.]